MFHLLLIGVTIAAAIHVVRLPERTSERVAELVLLYLLIGYCGVPMAVVSGISLIHGPLVADVLGFPAGSPFQDFAGYALLGMSVLSLLAVRYRGTYLVGPAVVWAIFLAGATLVHATDYDARGALSHGSLLAIFASHGLIAVLLVGALLMSGAIRD